MIADKSIECDHVVVVLGGTATRDFTHHAGLRNVVSLAPVLGRAGLAGHSTRRLLRSVGNIDAIVGWGHATRALMQRLPSESRAKAFCIDAQTGRLQRADTIGPWVDLPVPALRPRAINASLTRESLRSQLSIAPTDRVVIALGDSACPPEANELQLAANTHAVCDRPMTLIVPACAQSLPRALRHVDERGYAVRMIVWDRPLARVLAAADLGVLAPANPQLSPFACGVWAALWSHLHGPGTLIAPVGNAASLPMPIHVAPSSRSTDLARGIFAAIQQLPCTPANLVPSDIPPTAALVRAIEHLAYAQPALS